ncbi:MAG: MBL fold metallo-hydrolase [Burkholderiales bacterium]
MYGAVQMMPAALIGALAMLLLPVEPSLAQGSGPQFDMTKVTENAYSFRFSIHRNMVLVTSDGVIVTDPMNPVAAQHMMAEIKKITDKPVKLVIYSHNHWDHIAGAKIFKDQGAKIIQHELAAKETRPSPTVVPADETFSGEKHVVTMGGQTVELIYVGRSHGAGMVVMRVPKERILHTIDVVTPGRIVFLFMPDFLPQDWIKALRKWEQLDYDRIIPGHGPASAPKSAVVEQRQYLEDLGAAVAEGSKRAGNPFAFDQITEHVKNDLRPKYGKWDQFDNWMMLNVQRISLEQRIGW